MVWNARLCFGRQGAKRFVNEPCYQSPTKRSFAKVRLTLFVCILIYKFFDMGRHDHLMLITPADSQLNLNIIISGRLPNFVFFFLPIN